MMQQHFAYDLPRQVSELEKLRHPESTTDRMTHRNFQQGQNISAAAGPDQA